MAKKKKKSDKNRRNARRKQFGKLDADSELYEPEEDGNDGMWLPEVTHDPVVLFSCFVSQRCLGCQGAFGYRHYRILNVLDALKPEQQDTEVERINRMLQEKPPVIPCPCCGWVSPWMRPTILEVLGIVNMLFFVPIAVLMILTIFGVIPEGVSRWVVCPLMLLQIFFLSVFVYFSWPNRSAVRNLLSFRIDRKMQVDTIMQLEPARREMPVVNHVWDVVKGLTLCALGAGLAAAPFFEGSITSWWTLAFFLLVHFGVNYLQRTLFRMKDPGEPPQIDLALAMTVDRTQAERIRPEPPDEWLKRHNSSPPTRGVWRYIGPEDGSEQ